ncbi:MAG: preprotein translocase subunit YajC [Holophagales bacterium]|jgi:preprotein translocase subunit YajC|nr:preprotein translocase subunit YajC [Holophagales bacterium]MBK9966821.1 preprotein translocase subunit YajC [Holophagales bacterium]
MNPISLLQAAAAPTMKDGLLQMVPFLLIFVVFYFVLLAPMRKQQKKTKEMLAQLKKGDRVMTSGGIYGTVAQVEDQIVWVKLADTLKVKMAKSAITSVVNEAEAGKEAVGPA